MKNFRATTPNEHVRFGQRVRLLAAILVLAAILLPVLPTTAQENEPSRPLSWDDAPILPPHTSEADWLFDTNQKTFAEAYGPFLTHTYEVGESEQFVPLGSFSENTEAFSLAYRSEHAYFWFEHGNRPDLAVVERVAKTFETLIWPLNTRVFGGDQHPGIDGDNRLHIVNQSFIGLGIYGAFSPKDQCPRDICPASNQRDIVYINLEEAPLGTEAYSATLAHEHQHLINFGIDSNETRWLNEALSKLSEHLNGIETDVIAFSVVEEFLRQPDHFLRGWDNGYGISRYYGAGYLFAVYLYERSGLDVIKAVAASELEGMASIHAAIAASGQPVSVDDIFADWVVANYLDDPYVGDGLYYYQTLDLPTSIQPHPLIVYTWGYTHTDKVHQYGADYLRITQPGTFDLSFDGVDATPLIHTLPKSGEWMWWSYNAANSATRLTGSFDLRGLDTATLAFSGWWDTEEDYDWFQILVSDNGGADWQVVGGPQASIFGPVAPSIYYSGQSNGWIDEQVDLSAYAGAEIMVRFEYLTDGNNTRAGIVLDDIGIVELGALDTVEDFASVWQPEGFLRIQHSAPQAWTITTVVQSADGTTTAHPMTLDALHTGHTRITVPDDGTATIIIGAMAPFTTNRADYKLTIQMEQP